MGKQFFLPVSGDHAKLSQKIVIDIFYVFKWLSLPLGDHLSDDKNKQVRKQNDEFKMMKKMSYVRQQRTTKMQMLVISESIF